MSADPQRAWLRFAKFVDLGAQTFAIALCIARTGRTLRTLLAEWQIVAQNVDPRFAEGVGYGD
jgi:hypothetical protein